MSERARALTSEEIETYRRDGVVCLRDALSDDWVAVVKEAVNDAERRYTESSDVASAEPTLGASHLHAMSQLGEMLESMGSKVLRDGDASGDTEGQFILVNNAVLDFPAVQHLAFESPLGEMAAQLFGADKVNFLFDQMFIKQPGANTRTAFHQDWGYFHVDGEQVASFWTAAEPVATANGGMGYVRGSHRWDLHSPNVFVGQAPMGDHGLPTLPDIEGHEDDYDIVYFDVEPGDVIVHDYRTVHGSRGNTSLSSTRRAVSLRFAGDDASVLHRPSAPAEFPVDPNLRDGDPLDSTTYPVVWPRS
ncbi:phytanoyl-CoA dioxygenase family protein [Ilumatobacter sp.]|uniref:phytanoyl-CoA dioxygenase family protein n=1 Tax=Ilumatobacter sp. TaxID=1967498 RepID=UPI003C3BFEFC